MEITDDLKPCPFCGAALIANDNQADFYIQRYGTHYRHPSNDCLVSGNEISPSEVAEWNRRAALEKDALPVPAGWQLVPIEPTPEMLTAMRYADWTTTAAAHRWGRVYRAMLAAAPQPGNAQQEKAVPDPKNCTATVNCTGGIITTKSCTTGVPLIDAGGSSDGERDYYKCPDCGKSITIDYREN